MDFFANANIPPATGSTSLGGSASDLDGSEQLLAPTSSLGKTGGGKVRLTVQTDGRDMSCFVLLCIDNVREVNEEDKSKFCGGSVANEGKKMCVARDCQVGRHKTQKCDWEALKTGLRVWKHNGRILRISSAPRTICLSY